MADEKLDFSKVVPDSPITGFRLHAPIPASPQSLGASFKQFTGWREGQKQVLEELLDSDKEYLLLEAPTGSGKTLVSTAYHKLSNLYGTVYCCTTKRLQDQYIEDFGAFAEAVKGKSNYKCLLLSGKEYVDASQCIDSPDFVCDYREDCIYRLQVEKARKAEVACLNIWALLFQIQYASRFTNRSVRPDEPRRRLLILDEADTLEDSLVEFASRSIGPSFIKKYRLFSPDFTNLDINYWKDWLEQSLNDLDGLVERAPTDEEKNKLRVAKNSLKFLYSNVCDTWVVERDPAERGVRIVPTDISSLAHRYIFPHYSRILLMSASFCGKEIFTDIMGIPQEKYLYLRVPSYFPATKRPIYFLPVANCSKRYEDQGSYETVIEAVDKILDVFNLEQVIIHTVSNGRAEKLQRASRHPVQIHNSTSAIDYIESFRSKETRILASPSLDRGYDFPDEDCRINIITKVPYPYLGGDGEITSVKVRKKNNSMWYYWKTIQKIVQMTGRSTRSPTDYSVTFILDSEFQIGLTNRGFGPLFPDWWKSSVKPVITIDQVSRELLERASK